MKSWNFIRIYLLFDMFTRSCIQLPYFLLHPTVQPTAPKMQSIVPRCGLRDLYAAIGNNIMKQNNAIRNTGCILLDDIYPA